MAMLEEYPCGAKTPFIYDRPVRGEEFLNRELELLIIFNRLRHGASTVISGYPRIGKTSLLLKLTNSTTQRKYLGDEVHQFLFVFLDLRVISTDCTPSTFWEKALKPLQTCPPHATIAHLAEQAATANYSSRSLKRLFNRLGQQGARLVLLLDQFEWVLTHPNFKGPAFFGLLRSLATVTRGLAIVAATRLRVSEMNQKTWGLKGSSLFNYMTQVRLRPFDEKTVDLLLDRGDFEPSARAFIRRMAGRHPFMLQFMADTLLSTSDIQTTSERFYKGVAFHFDELWYRFSNRTRSALIILSLLELGSGGETFNYEEMEQADIFGPDLPRLAYMGLADQVGLGWSVLGQNALVWRGERWSVSTQAFLWWVWDVVIAQSRRVLTYNEWLYHKRYRTLLTEAQWEELVSTVRNARQFPKVDVRGHSRALLEPAVKGD